MDLFLYGILVATLYLVVLVGYRREGGLLSLIALLFGFALLGALTSANFELSLTQAGVGTYTCTTTTSQAGGSTTTCSYQNQPVSLTLSVGDWLAALPVLLALIISAADLVRKLTL